MSNSNRNPLQRLSDAGQAAWLDSISRSYLGPGNKIETLIEAGEITGLTSNPSIFAKAVAGDTTYDEQVSQMQGATAREVLWAVMKSDIATACDAFAETHRISEGTDGFCSIEVDPAKAFDTTSTVEEAKSLWSEIDRPNLMVKVPGTEPGLPALTQLIAAGINVNVTLLFSVARYEAVIDAHMAGLEQRLEAGGDLSHVASVASFFVSRVDAKVDALLDEGHDLRGHIGVANARAAYGAFLAATSTPRWQRLAEAGAQVQRPLWASTSTKDPAYPVTLYVDELVGPDTVNTLPEATLDAFRDHGNDPADRLTPNLTSASGELQALSTAGIDLPQITKELETEGVESFVSSFEEAVATIEAALS